MLATSSFSRPGACKYLISIALVSALCGCTAKGREAELRIPSMNELQLTDDVERTMSDRREEAIAACMKTRGFDYPRLTFAPLPPELSKGLRRWGPLDQNASRTVGYHPTQAIQAVETLSRNTAKTLSAAQAQLSPAQKDAYVLALEGLSESATKPLASSTVELPDGTKMEIATRFGPDSCRGNAEEHLYSSQGSGGDVVKRSDALQAVVSQLRNRVDALAVSDAGVKRVLRKWSQCFSKSGFQAATPLEALENYSAPGPQPDARELQAAQADIICKEQVRFREHWDATLEQVWKREASKRVEIILAYAELRRMLVTQLQKNDPNSDSASTRSP